MVESPYQKLARELRAVIPEERLIQDELRLFACSTDASFYRLVPKLIVQVNSEQEIVTVMRACATQKIPFTFRAAGTSLSGQAVSDSVLIQISRLWNAIEVSADGRRIRCQPAALGGDANRTLLSFGRKIGPDPASVDSAMIAGIAANNASGMCCGNVQDTYHTLASARIVFADGAVLDTGSEESRRCFLRDKEQLVENIDRLAKRVRSDDALVARIRRKYRIKNTTGYSLHSLIDFEDPIDVIEHLLIGSEGTLAFFSEVTFNTVVDHPYRATALVLFPDVHVACDAARRLSETAVAAVELMDRHSLRSIENKPGIPDHITNLPENACALLVEVRSQTDSDRDREVTRVVKVLESSALLVAPEFTRDKGQAKRLWEIRKGLFPSLGYSRRNGTTIIIEDVAFPLEVLAEAAIDLRRAFERYAYDDAVIFGHALQGNLHFVFCVDFQNESEVRKYAAFMQDVVSLVADKYGGSLKAEHGTGRNMAPFVEAEWGPEAFAIMREIKGIFDPQGLLNPGVILNDDAQGHVKNLKQTPASHPVIEKCTECGFCERTCPSRYLTLTPRQRIAGWREISRLDSEGRGSRRLQNLLEEYKYAGDETCAVDGLCADLCPLGINTGAFIKELRQSHHRRTSVIAAGAVARHFGAALAAARLLLNSAAFGRALLGEQRMQSFATAVRKVSGNKIPEWNRWIPNAAANSKLRVTRKFPEEVVYFPSCVSRLFGASSPNVYQSSQRECLEQLLEKARYSIRYPKNLSNLCCGMAFSSKGFSRHGELKMQELTEELRNVTEQGRIPVMVDTSPCALRIKEKLEGLPIHDIGGFLNKYVIPRVQITSKRQNIAVHVPCSVRNTPEQNELLTLAEKCSTNVFTPESVPCCGFAGDRGFTHPELTASALVTLKRDLPKSCEVGYSTSRTCEIGLSRHGGISYQSIAYLVNESTEGYG